MNADIIYPIYDEKIREELTLWEKKILRGPSLTSKVAKNLQSRINNLIPEKAHKAITAAIKNMVRAVLFGSRYTSPQPLTDMVSLEHRDHLLSEKARSYQTAAVATGVWTGAGGLLLGLADFPILLGIKIKFLFDASSLYGFDSNNYKERLFILHIFQLAFSSPDQRAKTFLQIQNWAEYNSTLPENINDFDWRTFQQEYRDYIDLAKMLQLVPGIGAIVGGFANHKLMKRLEETTRNSYRYRLLNSPHI